MIDKNTLWFGDNLDVLRKLPDECVDLIYLDPPFNSNASYNMLFKEKSGTHSEAQHKAFEDTWSWDGNEAELAFDELIETCNSSDLVDKMMAMRKFLGENNLMAYLTMMAIRLIEMRRVLKDTGSIYLHCDPTASHYLKLVMDAVFGAKNYRNEIVWKRSDTHSDAKLKYPTVSDRLLFYTKNSQYIFNRQYADYPEKTLRSWYQWLEFKNGSVRRMTKNELDSQKIPKNSRRFNTADMSAPEGGGMAAINKKTGKPNGWYVYKGYSPPVKGWRYSPETMEELDEKGLLLFPAKKDGRIMRKRYLDEQKGVLVSDNWTDISQLRASMAESLGYPTQKPEALLERIINVSSNEGDIVLDPFCGCGTAVAVAERLNRKWIGIDITYLAVKLIRKRLKDTFGNDLSEYNIEGIPLDLKSAENLATYSKKGRFQFEWWALDAVDADYAGDKKMGSDKGIDGIKMFKDEPRKPHKKIVFQVKSGKVQFSYVQQLKGAMKDEEAEIGVLITLQKPTKPMIKEASKEGFYVSPLYPDRRFPRIQILTIEEIFDGKRPEYPVAVSFDLYKNAVRQQKEDDSDRELL